MNFEEFFSRYQHLRLAKPEDNDAIITFLKSISMRMTNMTLRYEFSGSIWKFLDFQGERTHVVVMENDDKTIHGYGVLSIRKYYIFGKIHNAVYLSDLRVAKTLNPDAKKEWKQCMGDGLFNYKKIDEINDSPYFYSAVLSKNVKALSVFNKDSFPAVFHPIMKYRAVSILGRKLQTYLLGFGHKTPQFTVMKAKQSDEHKLRKFLSVQNKRKIWGDYFAPPESSDFDEWKRRVQSWDNFNITDFILGKDSKDKIIFCTYPWSPQVTRRLVVDRAPLFYLALSKLFKLVGKIPILTGKPLKVLYLTHFEMAHELAETQKPEVLKGFFNYLYKTGIPKQYHSMTFCDYYDPAISSVLKKFICFNTPAQLYQIYAKENHPQIIELDENHVSKMSFEAAIV